MDMNKEYAEAKEWFLYELQNLKTGMERGVSAHYVQSKRVDIGHAASTMLAIAHLMAEPEQ